MSTVLKVLGSLMHLPLRSLSVHLAADGILCANTKLCVQCREEKTLADHYGTREGALSNAISKGEMQFHLGKEEKL